MTQSDEGSDSSEDVFRVNLCLQDEVTGDGERLLFPTVLATSSSEELRRKTCNLALADTCCARTVCGHEWMQERADHLVKTGLPFAVVADDQPFRFGDGPRRLADYAVVMPLVVPGCRKAALLRVSVVADDVPLLISSPVLRSLAAVVDLGRQVYQLDGETPMTTTSTGHIGFSITGEAGGFLEQMLDWDWQEFINQENELWIAEDRVVESIPSKVQGSCKSTLRGNDPVHVCLAKHDVVNNLLHHAQPPSNLKSDPSVLQAKPLDHGFEDEGPQGQGGVCGVPDASDDNDQGAAHGSEHGEIEAVVPPHEASSGSHAASQLEEILQGGVDGVIHQRGHAVLRDEPSARHSIPPHEQRSAHCGIGTLCCGGQGGNGGESQLGSPHGHGTEVPRSWSVHAQAGQPLDEIPVLGLSHVPKLQTNLEHGDCRSTGSTSSEDAGSEAGDGGQEGGKVQSGSKRSRWHRGYKTKFVESGEDMDGSMLTRAVMTPVEERLEQESEDASSWAAVSEAGPLKLTAEEKALIMKLRENPK